MQKFLHCLLLATILNPFSSFAQDFEYPNVTLQSVSFSGGNLQIRKDDGSGSFIDPHYVTGAVTQSPVAYVSGNAPTVAAVLQIDCPNVPDSIYVRGHGSDSIEFIAKKVLVGPPSGTLHSINYPTTLGSHVFANAIVRFFSPYTIDWEVSFDNGITWRDAGTSNNTLYVTKGTPKAESGSYKWFQTVFDLSCRNAQYETVDATIIAKIWNEFVDHVVLNYKGDSLFYYKAMNSPWTSLANLLKYKDAECYTFAQLFLASINIQGIIKTNNYVYITPINNTVCAHTVNRFIVKDWTFGTPSASAECPAFPYKNTYTTLLPAPYDAYNFDTEDVSDQPGIWGSCNIRPASYFNNHQIAKIDGVYYDPCYGVTFSALTDIKTAAFSGWGYRYTVGSVYHALFTDDMSQSDLSETITTF